MIGDPSLSPILSPKARGLSTGSFENIAVRLIDPQPCRTGRSIEVCSREVHFTAVAKPQDAKKNRMLNRSPQENLCLVALSQLTSKKGSFTDFNATIDKLKKGSDWQKALKELVKQEDESVHKQLASLGAYDIRGYDREALLVILTAVHETLHEPALEAVLDHLRATEMVKVGEGKMKQLNSGAVNVVYKVEYEACDERGVLQKKVAVFKPDPAELDAFTLIKEQHFGTATASGIPPGLDAHLPSRAVASSVVDGLLYPQDSISVKTRFALVQGPKGAQRGILMDMAPGKSPEVGKMETKEINLNDHPKVRRYLVNIALKKDTLGPDERNFLATMLKVRKVEIQGSLRSGTFIVLATTPRIEQLDPKNARTAEGLLRLQVKDYITGECDRHPKNYFIQDDGSVRGIDEDCCFGVNAVPKHGDIRDQPSLKGIIPNNASLMLRLPPVVTKDVQEQITALFVQIDKLKEALKPYISEKEIRETVSRLEDLYLHVHSIDKCLVVDGSADLLSDEAQARLNTNNSYWARELLVYSKDEKGWNYLRKSRPDRYEMNS